MATITAIKQQKRNPQRVNLYLDGNYAFPLAKIVSAWLKVGQELSPEKIQALQGDDAIEKTFQRALNFISYRSRSTEEVKRNLHKYKVPAEVIPQIIERLTAGGLLDDADFARRWVADRNELHPRGAYLLRLELRQRGVSEDLIEPTLSSLDEDELAMRAAEKKARQLAGLDWPIFRQNLSAFLARKGFSYDVTADTCRAIWQSLQEAHYSK
jgi:regulatory protein